MSSKRQQQNFIIDKLLSFGAQALSDAELLCLITSRKDLSPDAIKTANQWLSQLGGLPGLFTSDSERWDHNTHPASMIYPFKAIRELHRRYLYASVTRGQAFLDSKHAKQYLISELRHHQHEVFAAIFLDARHRMIQFERLFQGTLTHAEVYPRSVVKRALYYNAAALIIAHNHPSGVSNPSLADRKLTRRLDKALSLIEVRLLDHFIVADHTVLSFAEHGWL